MVCHWYFSSVVKWSGMLCKDEHDCGGERMV